MTRLADVVLFLKSLAPLEQAENWDNVGLLVGDAAARVERIMTCLTVTPDVAAEAVRERAQLIVTHHPVLFRPIQRLTAETPDGAMLLRLIAAGVAVYSAHTAFDSAREGINQGLCERLGLRDIAPLRPRVIDGERSTAEDPIDGTGRRGQLPSPVTLEQFLGLVRGILGVDCLQYVGDRSQVVGRVAVGCGSAAEFLPDARRLGCDVLLTGEARFHACLEARTSGTGLVLAGHYITERPAMELLAGRLGQQFPDCLCWASGEERDPVQWSCG
jgi:dinuclear metal center YbgI/SA1388 family protein